MALIELSLAPLLGAVLAAVVRFGRGGRLPAWGHWFPLGAAAWLAGVHGLIFSRFPDYALAYTLETRGTWTLAWYGLWTVSLLAATALGAWLPRAAWRWTVSLLLAAAGVPLWPRLFFVGSTLEVGRGLARPIASQPETITLAALTTIAVGVPVAGAALLVALDGLRVRRAAIR